jgi:hypothetical protein
MIDPVTPATLVPWRGKSYTCQATLGALAAASGALDVPILEPIPGNVFAKPEFFKRGVLLFALLRPFVPSVTIDACLEEVTGPKADFYLKAINDAYEHLTPAITRLLGGPSEAEKPPLAESSSGGDSGPALVSTSGSRRKSSGR